MPEKHYAACVEAEKKIHLPFSATDAQIYLELGRNTLVHNEDLTLLYERKALKIFDSLRIDSSIAATCLSLSFPLINKGYYNAADSVIQRVLTIAKKLNSHKLRIDALLRQGYKESASGNSVEALKIYFEIYDYYLSHSTYQGLGDVLMRIGIAYKDIGDCQTALKYWEKYLEEANKNRVTTKFRSAVLSNMAECYLILNMPAKAREFANLVVNNPTLNNSTKLLSQNYLLLAKIENKENRRKLAKSFIDSSYYYAQLFNNSKIISSVYLQKAIIYEHFSGHEYSLKLLIKALQSLKKAPSPAIEKEIYHELSRFHLIDNNLAQAFYFDQKKDSIIEKLFSNEVITNIRNIEKELERKNSAEVIKLLTTQNKLKNENIKQQKRINTYITSTLILALLLLGVSIFILYQRSKINKKLAEKNKAIETALDANKMLVKEIHHRVKNNLQLISSLLGLQNRFAQNSNVQQAIQSSKSRVQAMSLLHQNLYQTDEIQKVFIKKYFKDVCDNLIETYALENQNITFTYEIEDISLDLDQVVTLGLIMNELVTNAIRHAFVGLSGGSIFMKIATINQKLQLHIKDDGIGITFTELPLKSRSMGMQLITAFIKKLEAVIEISNQNGTEINIYCKI